MFQLVVLWGVFSYVILGLGWASLLTSGAVSMFLMIFLAVSGFVCLRWAKNNFKLKQQPILHRPLVLIIAISALVNLVGALGPELGFDALWYHLTIPRIWLMEGKIFNIPGGYFYYSLLPKNLDLIYLSLLPIFGQFGPKVLHWMLGLLAAAVTYKIARKWLNPKWSLLAAVIFYTNLVVGWQSITAYVDLGRTFLEALAFYYLVNKQNIKSTVVLGWAIATKLLAIGSLPIFLVIMLLRRVNFKTLFTFTVYCLLIPSPWFVWAYFQTGNPIYPIFSGLDLSATRHWWDMLTIWLTAADPISPIYFLVFPLWFHFRKKIPGILSVYCLLSMVVWWLIPRTGGGRFLMAYLPVFSVLVAIIISLIKDLRLQTLIISVTLVVAIFNTGWRGVANSKYTPLILGRQTQQQFLNKYLNSFNHNFFYLSDRELKKLYE